MHNLIFQASDNCSTFLVFSALLMWAKEILCFDFISNCNTPGDRPYSAGTCMCFLQVVIGVGDPNPLVGGSGVTTLLKAGIEVAYVGGEEERTCYDINEEFMNRMKLQAGK